MHDLIIIGAGPAGLAAAAYAIRKRLDVLVISPDTGGKTNHPFALPWLHDYQVIRGKEVVSSFKRELEYIDFARRREQVNHVDHIAADSTTGGAGGDQFVVHTLSGDTETGRALIVATGSDRVPLDVPGELVYLSRGVGYSAISYSHLFIDRTVFLIGNGPRVISSALDLALHAAHVTVVIETDGAAPGPAEAERTLLLERTANVTVLRNAAVREFRGSEYAETVVITRDDGTEERLHADGFFIEREPIPVSLPVADLVHLDAHGKIVVDVDCRTSRAGVFAAGDVTNVRSEQVLVALGEGSKAALSAYDYLLQA